MTLKDLGFEKIGLDLGAPPKVPEGTSYNSKNLGFVKRTAWKMYGSPSQKRIASGKSVGVNIPKNQTTTQFMNSGKKVLAPNYKTGE